MFTKIEELHDNTTNEGFYPLTHEQAVIDNNGIDLETKLNQINDDLETKLNQINNDISGRVIDYSKQYLTTVARENGTISFIINAGINTDLLTSISYSIDGGKNWITTNNTDNKEESIQIDVNVSEGDKVIWKGIGLSLSDNNGNVSKFNTNIPIDVEGNIMSLLYGDDFIGQTSLSDVGQNFNHLFGNYNNFEANVINVVNLILPATTLAWSCYSCMFKRCTNLITAPELPATTLAQSCYDSMFRDCTSLVSAPELPANTLAQSCYANMFQNCTSLTIAPELPATILAERCYQSMFQGCPALIKTSILPATVLAPSCYRSMFYGCSSLTQSPILPATTLAIACYYSMFQNCSALIQTPELPATTLVGSCYQYMFAYCTSLTQSPILPAMTLVGSCYSTMFKGCTKLASIKCLATNISATNSTNSWLNNVASSGTFITADNAPAWTRDANGIPNGWNIYTESEYEVVRHHEFDSNISITPFINQQQKINNKSINQVLIPIDSSKNNYNGDNLSDTTIITYISDTEKYLVLELDNIIKENYVIVEANLIGQGFYSNASILYNNGVAQIYSTLPLNSIKDNLEYLFISYYIN